MSSRSESVAQVLALKAELRRAVRSEPRESEAESGLRRMPARTRAWFLLAPGWTSTLASYGFPLAAQGLAIGETVVHTLERWAEEGLLERAPTGPPWDDTWYALPASMTPIALQSIVEESSEGATLLQRELVSIGDHIAPSAETATPPPALRRFLVLARAAALRADDDPVVAVGDEIDEQVRAAIDTAERAGAAVSPEGARWVEAATPLVPLFGRDIIVAVERARHRLEAFERRRRDETFLRRYLPRPTLEQAFVDLIQDDRDDAWALHYLGEGGFGKTMLVRRITSHYARELGLLTSRIDFDHLNPDYPARAPGLLLLALAEDLQLSDDTLVADQLREFNAVIGSAHQRIEGGDRSGARASPEQVRSLMDEAVLRFAGILRTVTERRRPVFVLDTCEELARIRPTGELPDAVTRTFDLLEQLQGEVKDLRVVFSGRRPLASEGDNWTDPRSPLPKRSWLRRAHVTGFDREEATRFLDQYSRERPIDRRYHDRILELSRTELTVAGSQRPVDPSVLVAQSRREAVEHEPRYNPFELDLYASWLTAADIEDPDRLLSADEHQYTRERIVQRVNERMHPWLSILAQLGHFDQALLERLAWEPETIVANVVSEITAQEWIEPERGAVWTDVPDAPSGAETTWVVHPRVKERLARFFRAEDEESWRRARTRLRSILPDFVLERPWSALVPEYFVVAFDVLCDTPDAAARWWQEVEKKIVRDAAWPWASEVLARLKDEGAPADRETWSTHPLQAMLLVTEAVVMRRQPGPGVRQFSHTWDDASRAAGRIPDPVIAARVGYRARAGLIGAIRWHDEPMDPASEFIIERWLYELPSLEGLEKAGVALDIEMLASELALIENLAEIFERVRWESAPAARVLDPMLARYTVLKLLLSRDGDRPDYHEYLALLEVHAARLLRLRVDLRGSRSAIDRALALLPTLDDGALTARLDWIPPQSIRVRVQLESMRLTRFSAPSAGPFSFEGTATLDLDRVAALAALIEADRNEPPRSHLSTSTLVILASAVISPSVETNTEQQPDCHAHVAVPPLFEIQLMELADSGAIREAVAEAEAIVRNATLPLDVRRAAERAYVQIAVKWRLVERGVARQTSLSESTSWRDRLAAATVFVTHSDPAARFTGFPTALRWQKVADDLRGDRPVTDLKMTMAERAHYYLDKALAPGIDSRTVRWHVDTARKIAESPECDALEPELALRARVRLGPWSDRKDSGGSAPARRIGEMSFEEGSLVIGWLPAHAHFLLSEAVAHFESCGDRLGVVLASLGSGLALARLGRFGEIAGELKRAKEAWDASDGRVPDLLSESVTDEWRPWADRARILEQLARDEVLNDDSRKRLQGMAIDAPWLDPDTAKPQAEFTIGMWGRTILRVSGNVGAVILALAFVAAGVGVFYKGFVGALGFLGIEGSTTFNVVAFIGTFMLIGWLPAVFRAYTRFFERAFLVLKIVDGPKDPVSIEQPLVATFRTVPVPLVGNLEPGAPGETDPRVEREAHRWRLPYVRQPRYLESGDSVWRSVNRLMMQSWRLQTRVLVPASIAGEPWEAFIWEQHTWAPFRQSRYAFMRTSRLDDVQPMWVRATGSAGEPFAVRPVFVRAQFSERSDERFLDQVWRSRTTENPRFMTDVRAAEARTDAAVAQGPGSAGLVHLLAPIRDDSRGLSIQGRFPAELITEFPGARLFILQRPPRSEDRRVESDRLDAWRARLFAAQLFDAGAPAVIVIPSLTTKLALEVMAPIAEAALGNHRRAVEPLAFAVREAQERIVDTLAPADEAAAIETAFDVCFYARAVVNLSV